MLNWCLEFSQFLAWLPLQFLDICPTPGHKSHLTSHPDLRTIHSFVIYPAVVSYSLIIAIFVKYITVILVYMYKNSYKWALLWTTVHCRTRALACLPWKLYGIHCHKKELCSTLIGCTDSIYLYIKNPTVCHELGRLVPSPSNWPLFPSISCQKVLSCGGGLKQMWTHNHRLKLSNWTAFLFAGKYF